jgi:hypothetical protein
MKFTVNYIGLEGKLIYTRDTLTHKTYRVGPIVVKVYKGTK